MSRAPLVLITGLTGFIAKHCALDLLRHGYRVRGTVRSLSSAGAIQRTLSAYADTKDLEFVVADLLSDEGWWEAMEGVHGVLHIASPFPMKEPKDESELLRPAVEGTLRVLRAAAEAGVERFVHTSSSAAIMEGHGKDESVLTENDWTQLDGPNVSAYAKSKTLAELAARAFVAEPDLDMHYASVNPGLVLGPLLDRDLGTSAMMVASFLKGRYPGYPRLRMPVVDVRDVATAHRLALETSAPSGGRYLLASKVCSMREIMMPVKAKLGDAARRVPTRELPDAAVKFFGLFDKAASSVVHALGRVPHIDNHATRVGLGMTSFIPVELSSPAMALSLLKFGIV